MDKIERFVELLSEGDEEISLGWTDDAGHPPSRISVPSNLDGPGPSVQVKNLL